MKLYWKGQSDLSGKQIIPRILLIGLIYIIAFFIIAAIQFSGDNTPPKTLSIDENAFNPRDFVISQAQNGRDFVAAVSRWQDGNFIAWNRLVTNQNDESLVIAFTEESLNRSSYSAAVAAIPAAFRNGNRRSYESSVFLGQLSQQYRSLISKDQETLNRLNSLLSEKSPLFLSEPDVFDFLISRGHTKQFNDGLNLAGSLTPEQISLELTPAIFQWDMEWQYLSSYMENNFSHLTEQAINLVSDSLRMNSEKNKVFAVNENRIDTIFNIRLGKALLGWAEVQKNDSWIMLARSFIISVLTLESYTGTIRAEYIISADGEITENPQSENLSTAHYYRILGLGEYSPRAVALSAGDSHIWAWTAGQYITTVMENNVLDISISFPVNETHYIIIRGIKPFGKIQLHGTDFRSDPQFERYDSSGWSYIAGDQTLLVKMKHRTAEEHIRIYF